MKMTDCKLFDSCNAPICPLDEQFICRQYLKGEPVCYFMSEAVKPKGQDKIKATIGLSASIKIQTCLEVVLSLHRPPNFGKLAHKLRLAMTTKSRLKIDIS
ncbi:hypothetical protein [Moraxella sp. CTOTU49803]|uniref:hypothetical protein n=1 Tax=Moraxella sp. CTOTU49803 TaxID=2953840 RepID=UPI0028AF6A0E|nr:hypothetical protein [Moraxella sp. CTOTU49803]